MTANGHSTARPGFLFLVCPDAQLLSERIGQAEKIGIRNDAGNRAVEYVYDAWGNCTIVSDTTYEKIGTMNPYRYKDY